MARRKHNPFIRPDLLAKIIGTVICFLVAVHLFQSFSSALFVIILVLGVVIATLTLWRRRQRANLQHSAFAKINTTIEANIDHLTRRRAQLVRLDAYGKPQLDKWVSEIDYFIVNHIVPALTPEEQGVTESQHSEVARIITERAFKHMQEKPIFAAFSGNMSAADFELFCAEQLRISGWNAHVTQRSRDQGIDVVAEKGGVRVVLQCKRYSGPVGNGAVQEVVAGKAHERAHYAAVVTNSRYTAPAEQLASTNGVLLLHYSDLIRLDKLLSNCTACSS